MFTRNRARRRWTKLLVVVLWLLLAAGYVHHQRAPQQLRPEFSAGLVPLPDELATAMQQARVWPAAYVATALRVDVFEPCDRQFRGEPEERPIRLQQCFELVEGGRAFSDVCSHHVSPSVPTSRNAQWSDGTTFYTQREDLPPEPPHRSMRSEPGSQSAARLRPRLQLGLISSDGWLRWRGLATAKCLPTEVDYGGRPCRYVELLRDGDPDPQVAFTRSRLWVEPARDHKVVREDQVRVGRRRPLTLDRVLRRDPYAHIPAARQTSEVREFREVDGHWLPSVVREEIWYVYDDGHEEPACQMLWRLGDFRVLPADPPLTWATPVAGPSFYEPCGPELTASFEDVSELVKSLEAGDLSFLGEPIRPMP